MAEVCRRATAAGARAAWVSAIVLVAVVASGSPAGAVKPASVVTRNQITAFARVGDCVEPTEGVTCHFVSAQASSKHVQIELTTIEVVAGEQVFVRDTLCNPGRARVIIDPKLGQVTYAGVIPAKACEQLVGDPPTALPVDVRWTAGAAPLIGGPNDCNVSMTINGTSAGEPLFCDVLVSPPKTH